MLSKFVIESLLLIYLREMKLKHLSLQQVHKEIDDNRIIQYKRNYVLETNLRSIIILITWFKGVSNNGAFVWTLW